MRKILRLWTPLELVKIIVGLVIVAIVAIMVASAIIPKAALSSIDNWSENNAIVIYQTYDGEGVIFENTKKEAFMEYYDKVNNNISQMIFGNDGKEYILVDGIEVANDKSPIQICREVLKSCTFGTLVRKNKIATNDSKGSAIKCSVNGYANIQKILGDVDGFDAIMQYYGIATDKRSKLTVYVYNDENIGGTVAYIVFENKKEDAVYVVGKLFSDKESNGELEIDQSIYEAGKREYTYEESKALAETVVNQVISSLQLDARPVEEMEDN